MNTMFEAVVMVGLLVEELPEAVTKKEAVEAGMQIITPSLYDPHPIVGFVVKKTEDFTNIDLSDLKTKPWIQDYKVRFKEKFGVDGELMVVFNTY